MPKVSVVMPVYNGEKYFAEAVDSILTQTFENFELIIIEDGSKDASAELLREYAKKDKRIRPIFLNTNKGVCAARQKGLEASRAMLVARMDADDISLPQRLRLQYDYLQENPDVGLLGNDYYRFTMDKDGRKKMLRSVPIPTIDALQEEALYQTARLALCYPSTMYRRELAVQAGGYRAFFKNGAEDHDFGLRMHELARVAKLDEKLYCYRIEPSSIFRQNKSGLKAGRTMARFCALQRRSGLADPISKARPLSSLPRLLGLPSSITLADLQQDQRWITELLFEWLAEKPFDRKISAQIYLGILGYRLHQKKGVTKALACLARAIKLDRACLKGLIKKNFANWSFHLRRPQAFFTTT